MNKKNMSCIVILLLPVVLSYCSAQNSNNNFISAKCDTTLNLDTPFFSRLNIINRYGNLNPAVKIIQFNTKKAGLKNYLNGYDSIAIRLWYEYSGPETEIVEIRKHCNGWIADFFTIKTHIEREDTTVNITSKKIGQEPKSGWANFTKKLFELHITTLPDFSEIPNYNAGRDSKFINVEISTKKYYRIYTYLGPKLRPNIKEVAEILKILELIDQEFGIKLIKKI